MSQGEVVSAEAKRHSGSGTARNELDDDEEKIISGAKDRFGFLVSDEHHRSLHQTDETQRQRREKEVERTKKWLKMLNNWDRYINIKDDKLRNRIRKGIPDVVRGRAWSLLLNAQAVRQRFPDLSKLVLNGADKTEGLVMDEIERDIDRTFPRHVQFVSTSGMGQASLRLVLQKYASLDPAVGYCQGMGFVAGLFLTYMIKEKAFYYLFSVMMVRLCVLVFLPI